MTVKPWIEIFTQPQNTTVNAGSDVTFFVGAVGSSPLTYQWRRNGLDIPGRDSESLTLTNVQTEAGTYYVLITSHGLTVRSQPATLTVNGNILPAIVGPPRSETIWVGAKALLRVTATGGAPLRYQWYKSSAVLGGETNTTLAFASIMESDAGTYTVRVGNAAGEAVSPPATLTVVESPFVFPTPGTVVNLGGATAPSGLDDVVSIAAGGRQGLALRSDGTVVEWGASLLPGQLTRVPAGLNNVVAIAGGHDHSLALRRDGTVVGWDGPAVPADLFGVITIAAGWGRSLAVKADGTVVSWGSSPARFFRLKKVE